MSRTIGHSHYSRHNREEWDFGFTKTYNHATKKNHIINSDIHIEFDDFAFSYDMNISIPRVRI